MNTFWQHITLTNLPIDIWVNSSYLHRWVGSLRSWRQQSWILSRGNEIGAILAAVVFAISPFVSTELSGLVIAGVAAFWVLLTLTDDRHSGITPIHVALLAYWGISAVATGLSPVRTEAIRGLGLLSLYLLLFVMLARLCRSPKIRNWLIAIYLNVAVVVSAYGVNQSIYGAKQLATWVDADSTLSQTTRVYSYLNNPNLLAGYLLPAIAFSVAAWFVWRGWLCRTLAVVMVVVNLWCLQATYSRGAWIGAVMMTIVAVGLVYYWLRPSLPKFWRSWALPMVLGSIFIVSAIAILLIPNLHDRVFSIASGSKDSSNNFRINVWVATQNMIHTRPILGWGPGDRVFKKIYPIYQVSPKYSALGAYSVFLETLFEVGILGFACLAWAIGLTVNCGIRAIARMRQTGDNQAYWLMAALVAIVGMLIQGLTDVVWYRPEVQTLWLLAVAIVASFYEQPADDITTPQ